MKSKSPKNRKQKVAEIADPETVLKAAEKAPRVFDVASYFKALYLMREKGHAWRYLSEWLTQFNINISHVHLHRLYSAEDARLDRLTEEELRSLGMPRKMIEERLAKHDPTKRLAAPDLGEDENEDPR